MLHLKILPMMSTENFLRGVDENLVKFAKYFKREGFHNEKHLKCIVLPEDLSVILHGEKVTLAERRQMEEALKTLKQNNLKKQVQIIYTGTSIWNFYFFFTKINVSDIILQYYKV